MAKKPYVRVEQDTEASEDSSSDADLESGSNNGGESSDEARATRPPMPDDLLCGIDKRPWLPVGLYVSTAAGGAYVLSTIEDSTCFVLVLALYMTSLGCMVGAALMDPGQIELDPEEPMPKRSHKSWQYPQPVRRYDHYCRWLVNTIGLRNHREFVGTLVTLILIGFVGLADDVYMAVELYLKGQIFSYRSILLALHCVYSANLLIIVGPIARIHAGLVGRNEVCQEWKNNIYYVIERDGVMVPVNELDTDDFNENFEKFIYDKSRNPWDKGAFHNCMAFWFTSRWSEDQMGEF
mmetsp:Transcript_3709/g.8393  ORF Transcript_3709/g.8393 Transcript_3709/m.8393 type:complete len:294 (-) Transcript_3709:89-970(-)|eukprot:CAMPEP_0206601092 /NCGR_PEP_ID=MMETSP0325_2-20121206/46344_1 /ASSEMBLY_ACC=CAM_ASM_000347 /TAXON_ID=2866 /ORGANISM="Crypthecodinium cohnii, Strain Seligo" /LENGTH=293 /DNA_ID=CAMNT_0054112839 /DNA_START=186 /DNA_END=1067 /DNA_ORIENTATION=+